MRCSRSASRSSRRSMSARSRRTSSLAALSRPRPRGGPASACSAAASAWLMIAAASRSAGAFSWAASALCLGREPGAGPSGGLAGRGWDAGSAWRAAPLGEARNTSTDEERPARTAPRSPARASSVIHVPPLSARGLRWRWPAAGRPAARGPARAARRPGGSRAPETATRRALRSGARRRRVGHAGRSPSPAPAHRPRPVPAALHVRASDCALRPDRLSPVPASPSRRSPDQQPRLTRTAPARNRPACPLPAVGPTSSASAGRRARLLVSSRSYAGSALHGAKNLAAVRLSVDNDLSKHVVD